MSVPRTPSQTVGPFFGIGLSWADGPFAVTADAPGAVWIRGAVLDGAGQPVPDALIETWQADPEGRFDHAPQAGGRPAAGDAPWFRGFARCPTDQEGRYGILTVKPGVAREPGGAAAAPHIAVIVFARGLLTHLFTRLYFEDEDAANASDPVLSSIGDQEARATLIAERTEDGYRFDIQLQGDRETVFFTV